MAFNTASPPLWHASITAKVHPGMTRGFTKGYWASQSGEAVFSCTASWHAEQIRPGSMGEGEGDGEGCGDGEGERHLIPSSHVIGAGGGGDGTGDVQILKPVAAILPSEYQSKAVVT